MFRSDCNVNLFQVWAFKYSLSSGFVTNSSVASFQIQYILVEAHVLLDFIKMRDVPQPILLQFFTSASTSYTSFSAPNHSDKAFSFPLSFINEITQVTKAKVWRENEVFSIYFRPKQLGNNNFCPGTGKSNNFSHTVLSK